VLVVWQSRGRGCLIILHAETLCVETITNYTASIKNHVAVNSDELLLADT
jgi:hypothetical protein